MFLTAAPGQYLNYLNNSAWWWKVTFILVAGLNIAVFELRPETRALVASVGAKTLRRGSHSPAPSPWARGSRCSISAGCCPSSATPSDAYGASPVSADQLPACASQRRSTCAALIATPKPAGFFFSSRITSCPATTAAWVS